MQCGARVGLDEFDAIPEREILGRYPYALAAFADLHASLGNLEEARGYLHRALENPKISSRPRSKHYSDESVRRSNDSHFGAPMNRTVAGLSLVLAHVQNGVY
jgi:predicted RNA polymerase sigma factor